MDCIFSPMFRNRYSPRQCRRPVEIDFDAFPSGETLQGEVIEVDPAETVIQGVIYYQTKVSLTGVDGTCSFGNDRRFRNFGRRKQDTLAIPVEALQYEGEQAFVYVLKNGEK